MGVPYSEEDIKNGPANLQKQALEIAKDIVNNYPEELKKGMDLDAKVEELKTKEVVAIIAYLQRLGTDIKAKPEVAEVDETVEK